jgi:hypothetical protein
MADISGFPYFEIGFTKDIGVVNPQQITDLINYLSADPAKQSTDVLVFSHGWNNDIEEARDLYRRFFGSFRSVVPINDIRKFVIVGILWPSKKFADSDLIPGGAAALNGANVMAAVLQQHRELADTLNVPTSIDSLNRAAALVSRLEGSLQNQDAWVSLVRQAIQTANEPEFDGADSFLRLTGNELFEILQAPALPTPKQSSTGGAAQLTTHPHAQFQAAASLGGLLDGVKGAALRILNYATYYVMKNRSGVTGRDGLNPQLAKIQGAVATSIRFHLIGHSFGGRLMTAAANGSNRLRIQTLTLLQAAYSHYGLAQNYNGNGADGYFRAIIRQNKVDGPILITHSAQDLAVGIAYAIASRIARQVAAAIGDPNDPYGGIGRNGAQKTPEATFCPLLSNGGFYQFKSHVPNNLDGDAIIEGHSDICKPEIAHALFSAIGHS